MKRKFLTLAFVFILAFSAFALFGCGDNTEIITTEEFQYTPINKGLEYEISGIKDAISGHVVIPSKYNDIPVTRIGDNAFYDCEELESIEIPNSITSIGSDAFYDCTNLKYNEYGNALYIGNENNPYLALIKANNTSIASCSINNDTELISDSAFEDCTGLTSITIPDSVSSIGNYALSGCTGLTEAKIQNGVSSIGIGTFHNCESLESITIPSSITGVGNYAFYGCKSLTSITFADTSTWYTVSKQDDWINKENGTETDVTNTTSNAAYLSDTYRYLYWYKK